MALFHQLVQDIKLIPSRIPYREVVEKWSKEKLAILESNEDPLKLEELLNEGQLEELVEQVKKEIALIPMMLNAKPWEADPDVTAIPIIIEDPKNRVIWKSFN